MPYTEQHLKQADDLIKSARVYAAGTFVSLVDEFPHFRSISDSNILAFWDYLVPIACIGTAFAEIIDSVPQKDQPGTCYAIQKKLDDWHSDSYTVMANFLSYVNNLLHERIELPDAIGAWIWVNIENHELANSELQKLASSSGFARTIGLPIMVSFHGWWKKK